MDVIKQSQADRKKTFQRDYDELLYFFPDADASRLEEVENFHRSLTRILGDEIKDSVVDIEAMIEIVAAEIKRLEEETVRIKKMPNAAMAGIDLKLDGIMEEMNSTMYADAMKAPVINVESATSYTFYTLQ